MSITRDVTRSTRSQTPYSDALAEFARSVWVWGRARAGPEREAGGS
ncbi:hypothetical protein [Kribbella caucasensis]|nr:hypothetical protein [Kribbella sp. VKM Ac-2527]